MRKSSTNFIYTSNLVIFESYFLFKDKMPMGSPVNEKTPSQKGKRFHISDLVHIKILNVKLHKEAKKFKIPS